MRKSTSARSRGVREIRGERSHIHFSSCPCSDHIRAGRVRQLRNRGFLYGGASQEGIDAEASVFAKRSKL